MHCKAVFTFTLSHNTVSKSSQTKQDARSLAKDTYWLVRDIMKTNKAIL